MCFKYCNHWVLLSFPLVFALQVQHRRHPSLSSNHWSHIHSDHILLFTDVLKHFLVGLLNTLRAIFCMFNAKSLCVKDIYLAVIPRREKNPIDLGFFLQCHGLLCLKLRDLQSLSVIVSLFSLQTLTLRNCWEFDNWQNKHSRPFWF